jgi:endonuclease/exonuclease/phosphatase family metal-dependent hydrolase
MSMGTGTDYVYDLNRTATTIANQSPDVVFLCEALRSDDDQAQILRDKLSQITGVTWYFYWSEKFPDCTEGNVILSKWPFISTSKRMMSYGRSVARATISINGKTVNFFATHLDHESSYNRSVEVSELTSFMSGFSGPRIVGGDFNAGPDTYEVSGMYGGYYDSWNEAMNAGTATAYPDNPVVWMTRTRRGRIDYIWYSRGTSNLSLINAKIPDLRDLSRSPSQYIGTSDDWGVRPSDHNLVVAKFEVR